MDDVTECVLAYIHWTHEHPIPGDIATRAVIADLRSRLDVACPGWRGEVCRGSSGEGGAIKVEVHLAGGRVIRGALHQCPSRVTGEGAAWRSDE